MLKKIYFCATLLCVVSLNGFCDDIMNRDFIQSNIYNIKTKIGMIDVVYLKLQQEKPCCIIVKSIEKISHQSMIIEYKMYDELDKDERGGISFLDGLGDKKLDQFAKQYTPAFSVLKKIDKSFLEKNNLDNAWHMSEIGYIVVNDEKNPWRWAVTFIKEINQKIEKKSFVLEDGIWMPQTKSIKYYFAPFLIDVED